MTATPQDIISAVETIVNRFKPQSVVLFGSFAYGTPNQDSDVDLLVLKEFPGSPHRQFTEIRRALDTDYPVDLLVRRPAEVTERVKGNDFFLAEVMAKGIVLHDADDSRVGEKGRKRLRRRFDVAQFSQA